MNLNLTEYISHPETMDEVSLTNLRRIVDRYPYFQPARLLYLRNLYQLHDSAFDKELRKAAIYVTDRKALFMLIEGDNYRFSSSPNKTQAAKFTKEEETDRTGSLIDSFLSNLPKEKPRRQVPADVSTDYIAYLMQNTSEKEVSDETPRMQHQDLIDNFIGQGDKRIVLSDSNGTEETVHVNETENSEEEYFTLTLAKIYIKQEKYAKALEIIRKLSLKYPKKNRYFADQIRFLEKLIINNKYKNS